MKTTQDVLAANRTLPRSLRVLTGATYSGKRAIYISGTPDGLRLLADLLLAQADAPDNDITKLTREADGLFFTTEDSVDTFEIHVTNTIPNNHSPKLE